MRIDSDIRQRVELADKNKKVNPLDLSSDQDLTIAIMNLIAIEDMCGGKLSDMVCAMRQNLMRRVVNKTDDMDVTVALLGGAIRRMDAGNRAMDCGDAALAYRMYDDAYGLYSLFWGVVMGMVSGADIDLSEYNAN